MQRRFLATLRTSSANYIHSKLSTHLKVLSAEKMCTIFAQQIETTITDRLADKKFSAIGSLPYTTTDIVQMISSPIMLNLPRMDRGFLTHDLYSLMVLLYHLRFAHYTGGDKSPLATLRVCSERKPAINRVLKNFRQMYPDSSLPRLHVHQDDMTIEKLKIIDFLRQESNYSVNLIQEQLKHQLALGGQRAEEISPLLVDGLRLSDVMRRAVKVLDWEAFSSFPQQILRSADSYYLLHMIVARGKIENPTIISPSALPRALAQPAHSTFSWLECSPWYIDQLAELMIPRLDVALRYFTTFSEAERKGVLAIHSSDVNIRAGWLELSQYLINLLVGPVDSVTKKDILFTRDFFNQSPKNIYESCLQSTPDAMDTLNKCLHTRELQHKNGLTVVDVLKSIKSQTTSSHKPMYDMFIERVLDSGNISVNGNVVPVESKLSACDILCGQTLLSVRFNKQARVPFFLPRMAYMIKWS